MDSESDASIVAVALLGELFRIAFEKRSTYERDRENARPWLYGIATG
jgi:hypothetical protein